MTNANSPSTNGFSRREFLGLALLVGLGALAVKAVDVGLVFLRPRSSAGEYGGLFDLGTVADLPAAGDPPLHVPAGQFYLMHSELGLLALHKVCTHLDCLSTWDDQNGAFICPCHGSQFAADGAYVDGPAPRDLDRFVVQLVDAQGTVVAETDPLTGDPLPLPVPAAGDDDGDEPVEPDAGDDEAGDANAADLASGDDETIATAAGAGEETSVVVDGGDDQIAESTPAVDLDAGDDEATPTMAAADLRVIVDTGRKIRGAPRA